MDLFYKLIYLQADIGNIYSTYHDIYISNHILVIKKL